MLRFPLVHSTLSSAFGRGRTDTTATFPVREKKLAWVEQKPSHFRFSSVKKRQGKINSRKNIDNHVEFFQLKKGVNKLFRNEHKTAFSDFKASFHEQKNCAVFSFHSCKNGRCYVSVGVG